MKGLVSAYVKILGIQISSVRFPKDDSSWMIHSDSLILAVSERLNVC